MRTMSTSPDTAPAKAAHQPHVRREEPRGAEHEAASSDVVEQEEPGLRGPDNEGAEGLEDVPDAGADRDVGDERGHGGEPGAGLRERGQLDAARGREALRSIRGDVGHVRKLGEPAVSRRLERSLMAG